MRNRVTPEFSKYQVVAELDHGGMAQVFLCMAKGVGGFCKLHVLKCVREELLADPTLISMFLDEAKLAARLNHPNVVQTFEVGNEEHRYYLAMEYLEGQSLAALIRAHAKKKLSMLPREIYLRVLCEAMQGLHYAHELCDFDGRPLNIIHRDVSPQNIFITYTGSVKVLDFGIAKATLSSNHTQPNTFKGKTSYVAPEQASGDASTDRRADIFSMGMLLWQAAVGRPMWRGESDVQKVTKILSGDLLMPLDVNPSVPPELDAIVRRCLRLDPDERYQTMSEVRQAVDQFLRSEPFVDPEDISKLLGELFTTERSDISARVRNHVQRMEEMAAAGASVTPIRLSNQPAGGVRSSFTGTAGNAVMDVEAAGGPTHRSMLVASAIGVTFAAMAIVGVLGIRYSMQASAARNIPAASLPPPPPPTTVVSDVAVTIDVTPPTARISFDGKPVDGNPFTGKYRRDMAEHYVHAEAPGFASMDKAIDLGKDQMITLALQPIVAVASTPPAARAPVPAKTTPAAAAATTATPTNAPSKPVRKIEKEDPYK